MRERSETSALLTCPATIYVDRLSREITGFVGGHIRHSGANLARVASTTHRNLREDTWEKIRPLHYPFCHVRINESGMHTIHANTERGNLGLTYSE